MNRQELFGTRIITHETQLDTSYLPFIKPSHRRFCDVNYPRFFSGWPYFILILATLLIGTTKVSSQGLLGEEHGWATAQQTIASGEYSPKEMKLYLEESKENTWKNRCEISPFPKRRLASADFSAPILCSTKIKHPKKF